MTTGKRKWRVDFVSGSYVDWAEVEASFFLEAVDKAFVEFTDDRDPLWPYHTTNATLTARVIE